MTATDPQRTAVPAAGAFASARVRDMSAGPLRATAPCRASPPLALARKRTPTRPPPQAGEEVSAWTASCPNRPQHMNFAHTKHERLIWIG